MLACGGDSGATKRDADAGADGGLGSEVRPLTTETLDTECGQAVESSFEVLDAVHVNGKMSYPDKPPVGGNHNPCWGKWGVHDKELGDRYWVHNLEHGGVAFLYNCPEGCPDEQAALEGLVEGRPLTVVTPYAALPTRFAVVAWGHRIVSDCLDLTLFERFYGDHVGHGPEAEAGDPPPECL